VKIIAFTGMPFSGKSEAVQIARDIDIPVIRMGDMVWEEVKKRNLDLTSENVGKIAHELRIKKGDDIWAKRTIKRVLKMGVSHCLVIDGIRNIEEINVFKNAFGADFLLISIIASDAIRHQRAQKRNRIDDSNDLEEIKKRDVREIQWGIKKVMRQADKSFYNEQSLKMFKNEIKRFFKTI
jgi:dephospho-CoA kinase